MRHWWKSKSKVYPVSGSKCIPVAANNGESVCSQNSGWYVLYEKTGRTNLFGDGGMTSQITCTVRVGRKAFKFNASER